MLLLGHRGARRYAAENTFAAFDLALEHGCHGFEFDVRLTADARLAICHNARIGGRRIARSAYSALGLPKPLRLRRRGRDNDAASSLSSLPLPCLEDVLERYASSAFLDIELKVAGMEHLVVNMLRRYPPQRGFLLTSFLPEVLEALRARSTRLPLGYLADRSHLLRRWPQLDVQTVLPHYTLASRRRIEPMKAAGKQVIIWTVNRARAMKKFAELGADGIISDDSLLLSETFQGK